MPLAALALLLAQADDGPPSKAPDAGAKPLVAHQWKSAGGLRYVWWLPEGYDKDEPRHLTVILHGTGLDYRWGFANNPAGVFRPRDVVVSVDGTSPGPNGSRLFLDGEKDAEAFAAFLGEMRAAFAVDRVFLYGHSQGGFFVAWFAGLHPELVAGVCAHASGAWSHSETGKKAQKVAVAFLHATGDPVVPYGNSSGSWAAYRDAGFPMLLLRRIPGYLHWPNAVRATECLDWCEAMTTKDPERALELAAELLRPKGEDMQGLDMPPAFAAAAQALARFGGDGHDPFGNLPPMAQGRADELAAALDKQAAEAAEALQKEIGKKLALGPKLPLAGLVAFRADFRGVPSAERWLAKLGYDKLAADHDRDARKVNEAWYADQKSVPERFAAICEGLEDAWLHDGYPAELAKQMAEWRQNARSLELDKKALKAYDETVEAWAKGWAEGYRPYQQAVRGWKPPK